jgi:hypothetical protein
MRTRPVALAAAMLAMSLPAADALAADCYEIIDANQNVTFRASQPPFAMDGPEWRKHQDELRTKNQHLRWHFTVNCSPMIVQASNVAGQPKSDQVFDPNVILRSTPEYMTASGRPTSTTPGR